MKQSSLDDHDYSMMDFVGTLSSENGDEVGVCIAEDFEERRPAENNENNQMYSNYQNRPTSPPVQSTIILPRGLPWKPKVRQKDIDMFLDGARIKFVGYSLQGDRTTLFGLPEPIHEGVKTLKEVCNQGMNGSVENFLFL